jgi:phospholipid/cholesterol/gamma-HCH transport system substrate-binding protein
MQKGREIKIGILVLLGGAVLVLGVNYLKGFNPLGGGRAFHAVYENIDGLAVSNPVVVNGFQVGQVASIGFASSGSGDLLVTFIIEQPNLRLSRDSKARIYSNDLFGTKAIELLAGRSLEFAEVGDTLQSEIEMGITEAVKMELIPLRQKTDQLIAGVDEILINLQTVFEDSATQGLPQAFESIQRTMQNLENTSATLDLTVSENRSALKGIVDNMEELTGFVNTQQGALSNALGNFSQISDSLADLQLSTTLRKADASITELNRLLEGLNNGEGSLGKLLQDDTLHNGLLATNKEVQNLINDLYLNPQRYVRVSVFGRKENRRMSEKELERLQRLIQNELEGRAEDED